MQNLVNTHQHRNHARDNFRQHILDILHLFSYCISHTIVHCVKIYTPRVLHCLHSPFCLRIVLHYSCCLLLYTCRPLRPSLQHFSPLPAVSLHVFSILALFTCRFHYPPFPYRIAYTQLPLAYLRIPHPHKMRYPPFLLIQFKKNY